MPRFDTRSQHVIEVHAPAEAVFTVVEAVTVKEVRFLRELEFIRALPRLAATGRLDVPPVDAHDGVGCERSEGRALRRPKGDPGVHMTLLDSRVRFPRARADDLPRRRPSSQRPGWVYGRMRMIVFPLIRSVRLRAATASARVATHGHDTGSCTAPLIVKLHSSSCVRGVGPADSTGKSRVTTDPAARARDRRPPGGRGSLVRTLASAEHGRASVDRQAQLAINRYARDEPLQLA